MRSLLRLWWRLVERSGLRPGFATLTVDDLPDALAPERLYLVGEDTGPWSAALLCPCGCEATIQLSLLPDDEPSWRAVRHFNGSVSLRPSVWRTRGCRSHFFLRRGRIVWTSPLSDAPHLSTSRSTSHGPDSGPNPLRRRRQSAPDHGR